MSNGLLLFPELGEGVAVTVFVNPLTTFELPPLLTLVLVLVKVLKFGVVVAEGTVGGAVVMVAPLESIQVALPVASRPQVVPARQQKFSPGHSTAVLSAHPGLVEVQSRSRIMFTRVSHQRW